MLINGRRPPIEQRGNKSIIFLHIPKCGGTSITQMLGYPVNKHHHFSLMDVINKHGFDKAHKAYKFTFVRNPWDRAVSYYKHRTKYNECNMQTNPIEFKAWIKKVYGKQKDAFYYDVPLHFAPCSHYLKDGKGHLLVNFIGRFENYKKDIEIIKKQINYEKKDTPHKLKSNILIHYSKYYDEETKQIVADFFHEDIRIFGYKFEEE